MKKISILMVFCFLLSACSNINSVQVFDDKEAALLAQKMVGNKASQHCTK